MYDITIIGAGIIGSFLARDLARYQLDIAVIEKESDVANGATMANSAIVHAGHDPHPGTLKAELNVRGNRMYEGICKELGVDFKRTSAYVAATTEAEKEHLAMLYKQAQDRGIPAAIREREEAVAAEPNLSDQVLQVLELPSTGVIYPWEVSIALMEEAVLNGAELFLEHEVIAISGREGDFKVQTTNTITGDTRTFQTRYLINAAGVYADDIYALAAKRPPAFRITPRKGEYYVLDQLPEPFVKRVIYPVPSAAGKGVLAVPTTHGNTLLGPTAQFIEEKDGINNTAAGLAAVKQSLSKTIRNIPSDKIIRVYAGLRPTGDTGDFVIKEAEDVAGFFMAAGIESPGLASAPAISEYMIENLIKPRIAMTAKDHICRRTPPVRVKDLDPAKRQELARKNPAYARIICRCEQVSEGEILDAIHRPVGARTVKAVKKRVRPGMGRCQGGFCEPHVIEILARELKVPLTEIRLDKPESELLVQKLGGAQ